VDDDTDDVDFGLTSSSPEPRAVDQVERTIGSDVKTGEFLDECDGFDGCCDTDD
jgi:hypothetical protein